MLSELAVIPVSLLPQEKLDDEEEIHLFEMYVSSI